MLLSDEREATDHADHPLVVAYRLLIADVAELMGRSHEPPATSWHARLVNPWRVGT